MIAPRIVPIIGTAYTDDSDCCADENAVLYHVAVAPDERLDIQARVAKAVYKLERPITENCFYGAALLAEDDHFGVGQPWPTGHIDRWLVVVDRMYEVVRHTQLVCS